jgi:PKD repeat protein
MKRTPFIRFIIFGILAASLVCGTLVSAESAAENNPGIPLQPAETGRTPAAGHQVWNYTTGSMVTSSPAVDTGVVYIGSEDGNLYAMNAESGSLIWKFTTGGYVSSSPKISGGLVYVGSGDRTLYALNAASGTPVWSCRTGSGISTSPALAEGIVYFGSEDGTIYALDADSGTEIWNYTTGNYLHSSPEVNNGVLYIGSYDHNLYALDAATGSPLWKYTTGNTILSSPAVAEGMVYIGSYDHNVYALDAGSGTEVWRYTTGNTILSSPVVAGGTVYIGSSDGNIYALDAGSGTLAWTYKTGSEVDSTPLVADGIVYAGSGDGNLYALDAATGNLIWDYPVGSPVDSSPSTANGMIYVGSNDHRIYALSNQPPVADFIADTTGGITPLVVHFTDLSYGSPTSWLWDFGDGEHSTDQNPVHAYLVSGTFSVNLTATNGGGSGSRERAGYLATTTILPPAPVAGFKTDLLIGTVPFTVQFLDTSSGYPTAWLWDFGDGNISTREHPAYTYLKPGNYTVALTAQNRGGSSSMTLDTPIKVFANVREPDPDFKANTTSGVIPLAVQFTDTSIGPDISGWAWDFDNDGTIDSTDKDPVCVYKLPGNYTVNLKVTNPSGIKTVAKTEVINARSLAPVITFTANSTTGTPPFTVQFTDTSTGPNITSWTWDFDNDGTIDSTEQNPVCVYYLTGNYTVNLTAASLFGTATGSQTDFISVTNGMAAGFTADQVSGMTPLSVQFTDSSTGSNITGWSWDFDNDGTIDSTEQNPVCVYTRPGNYTVNLKVTNEFGSTTVSKTDFVTATNGVVADFTAEVSQGIIPLSVQFKDTSSGPDINGWTWDFDNDGTIDSTEQNPVCVYTRPGNYTVTFTVTNPRGTNVTSRQGFILASSQVPVAAFTADNTTGISPLSVQFKDTSSGQNISGWAWDFNNDGTIDSTEKDPVCVYTLAGDYTVTLTATNTFGSNTTTSTGFIEVASGVPRARFAVNRTGGSAPLAIQFKDTTIGSDITGLAWDFNGDGIIDSTEQNPSCVYNLPGEYTINLTSTNAYGSNSTVRQGFIKVT